MLEETCAFRSINDYARIASALQRWEMLFSGQSALSNIFICDVLLPEALSTNSVVRLIFLVGFSQCVDDETCQHATFCLCAVMVKVFLGCK